MSKLSIVPAELEKTQGFEIEQPKTLQKLQNENEEYTAQTK